MLHVLLKNQENVTMRITAWKNAHTSMCTRCPAVGWNYKSPLMFYKGDNSGSLGPDDYINHILQPHTLPLHSCCTKKKPYIA